MFDNLFIRQHIWFRIETSSTNEQVLEKVGEKAEEAEQEDWEREWDSGNLLESFQQKLEIEQKVNVKKVKGRGKLKYNKEEQELGHISNIEDVEEVDGKKIVIKKDLRSVDPTQVLNSSNTGNYQLQEDSRSFSSNARPSTTTATAKRMIGNILQIPQLSKDANASTSRKQSNYKKDEKKNDYWEE